MRGNKHMSTNEDAPLVQPSGDWNQRGARSSTPDPWHDELQNIVDLPNVPARGLSPGKRKAIDIADGLKLV